MFYLQWIKEEVKLIFDTYALTKGRYFIGDPTRVIKKTPEGNALMERLWETFYKDIHRFHQFNIEGITLFITRTKTEGSTYKDIETDTNAIMILNLNQLKGDARFNLNEDLKGCLYMDINSTATVKMDDYNLFFSNGFEITTHL